MLSDDRLVGVERFELPTSCSQSKRATGLRYTPNRKLYHFARSLNRVKLPRIDLADRRFGCHCHGRWPELGERFPAGRTRGIRSDGGWWNFSPTKYRRVDSLWIRPTLLSASGRCSSGSRCGHTHHSSPHYWAAQRRAAAISRKRVPRADNYVS
jgi:hypothetical protein